MDSVATTRLIINGQVLKRKRLEAVLTPEQLGTKAGLTASSIYHMESSGERSTNPKTAQKLAKALRCRVTELTYVTEQSP